jgi:hypothetical protein
MDGWINVGKRERREELDEGEFLLRADGKLDRTASTNNGVQHETTRIEENERKKKFQQKTKMREKKKLCDSNTWVKPYHLNISENRRGEQCQQVPMEQSGRDVEGVKNDGTESVVKYWAWVAKLAGSAVIREFASLVIGGQQRFLLDVSIVDPLLQQLVVRGHLGNKRKSE